MKRIVIWAPLAAFVAFFVVVASGLLRPDDRLHPSKLIGKPVPAFALAAASSTRPGLASNDLKGSPRLLNVFASWCVPCVSEAGALGDLARRGVMIDGVAIRDRRDDLDAFLARNGNPYRAIGSDPDSSVQLAMGSAGVPETFVIDARGTIRYQHIGEITPGDVPMIVAKLADAR